AQHPPDARPLDSFPTRRSSDLSPRSISEGTKIVNTRFTISTSILRATASLAKLGSIVDDSVQAGIVDFFRSLTYSRSDEEGAKQRAVSEAMKRAIGRANLALGQKGQKVGALRFARLDVRQL